MIRYSTLHCSDPWRVRHEAYVIDSSSFLEGAMTLIIPSLTRAPSAAAGLL